MCRSNPFAQLCVLSKKFVLNAFDVSQPTPAHPDSTHPNWDPQSTFASAKKPALTSPALWQKESEHFHSWGVIGPSSLGAEAGEASAVPMQAEG